MSVIEERIKGLNGYVLKLLLFLLPLCARFCGHIPHFLSFHDSIAHLSFLLVSNLQLMTSVQINIVNKKNHL